MSRITPKVQKELRKVRTTSRLHGTSDRPRLAVTISNKSIHAQIINDDTGTTVYGTSVKKTEGEKIAKDIAKAAKTAKIEKLVFDRRDRNYHGKLASIADMIRKEGIQL